MLKSRRELFSFISEQLKLPITSLDVLSDGLIYGKLLYHVFPNFPIYKLKSTSSYDSKFLNMKILQTFLDRNNLKVNFSIDKIIQGSIQENFELCQFICNLVQNKLQIGDESFILSEASLNSIKIDDSSEIKRKITKLSENKIENENNEDFNKKISKLLAGLEDERNFYYKKCLRIESLLKKSPFLSKKHVEDILYDDFKEN